MALEQIVYRDVEAWGSPRIYVGGRDWTNIGGHSAQIGMLGYQDPFTWAGAELRFPGIDQSAEWGVGDLEPLQHMGAQIRVMKVDADGVESALMWRGFVQSAESTPEGVTVTGAGWIAGQLEAEHWPGPTNDPKMDVGRRIYAALRRCGCSPRPILGLQTGQRFRPNLEASSYAEFVSTLLTLGSKLTGERLTVNADSEGRAIVEYQDRTTVVGKVFANADGVSLSVMRDLAEEPTAIYGTGESRKGEPQRNVMHPGRMNGDPDNYPGSPLSLGDVGPFVGILKARMILLGFMSMEEAFNEDAAGNKVPGTFNVFSAALERAVKKHQRKAGLSATGVVNEATWNKMYDVSRKGRRRKVAYIAPIAILPETEKYTYTSTGVIDSPNPSYDRTRRQFHRPVDAPVPLYRLERWAEGYMARVHEDPPFAGTLTLDSDIWPADHVHGEAPSAETLSRLDAYAYIGRRIQVGNFMGGSRVFYISGVELTMSGDQLRASCHVDSAGRDLQEVIDIVAARRDTQGEPSRRRRRNKRRVAAVSHKPTDDQSGWLGETRKLAADAWSVIEVDWGLRGVAGGLYTRMESAQCEFAVAVFSQKVTAPQIQRTAGDPFVNADWAVDLVERFGDATTEENGIVLFAAGNEEQPCGYSPRLKFDPLTGEATGAPLTGKLMAPGALAMQTFGRDDREDKIGSLYLAYRPRARTTMRTQRLVIPA